MPVVLDNDPGERVLLYGADGSTLRKVVVDSSGRLVVVGPGAGGAMVVSATNLDIRDLVKAQDELYAVLRTDAGVAYDARARSWTVTEDVLVHTSGLTGRAAVSEPRERATIQVVKEYGADNVAPHGLTQRWTYTVPAGKKAILETVFVFALRQSAATSLGLAFARARYTPSGGSQIILVEAAFQTNSVGDKVDLFAAPGLLMLAGDNLDAGTIDQGTGGTVRYIVTAKLAEFDA